MANRQHCLVKKLICSLIIQTYLTENKKNHYNHLCNKRNTGILFSYQWFGGIIDMTNILGIHCAIQFKWNKYSTKQSFFYQNHGFLFVGDTRLWYGLVVTDRWLFEFEFVSKTQRICIQQAARKFGSVLRCTTIASAELQHTSFYATSIHGPVRQHLRRQLLK